MMYEGQPGNIEHCFISSDDIIPKRYRLKIDKKMTKVSTSNFLTCILITHLKV